MVFSYSVIHWKITVKNATEWSNILLISDFRHVLFKWVQRSTSRDDSVLKWIYNLLYIYFNCNLKLKLWIIVPDFDLQSMDSKWWKINNDNELEPDIDDPGHQDIKLE